MGMTVMDYSFHLSEDGLNKQRRAVPDPPTGQSVCPDCEAATAAEADHCTQCGTDLRRKTASLSPEAGSPDFVHPLDRLRPSLHRPAKTADLDSKNTIGSLFPYSVLSNRKVEPLPARVDRHSAGRAPHAEEHVPMQQAMFPEAADLAKLRRQNRLLMLGIAGIAAASIGFAVYDLLLPAAVTAGPVRLNNPEEMPGAPAREVSRSLLALPSDEIPGTVTTHEASEKADRTAATAQQMPAAGKPESASATDRRCASAAAAMGLCDMPR